MYRIITLLVISIFINLQLLCQVGNHAEVEGLLKVSDKIDLGNSSDANTIVGLGAGDSIITGIPAFFSGTLNTYFGAEAGRGSTSAYKNTYIGAYAGATDKTNESNTFVGSEAGRYNSSNDNTFVGSEVGSNNKGSHNTFVGHWAGRENEEGFQNTFIGRAAGRDNKTGSYNTYIGYEAGCENSSGNNNTGLGFSAGYFTTTGYDNTFVGKSAGEQNIDGYRNTFLGTDAGIDNLTGKKNTFLGYNTYGSNVNNSENQIVIGYNTIGIGDNRAVIGNGDITDIYMNQNGDGVIHANATIISSDIRLKQNIAKLEDNMEKINKLRPVSFSFIKSSDKIEYGFVAQEVINTHPSLVVTRSNGYYGVKYEQIIAILTGALQEQDGKIKQLETSLSHFARLYQQLDKEIKDLRQELQSKQAATTE
ncbi:MAG: hypothetical protein ACJA1A_003835 [Saprospiraceae bacterium]|jgi:hypothetical protein